MEKEERLTCENGIEKLITWFEYQYSLYHSDVAAWRSNLYDIDYRIDQMWLEFKAENNAKDSVNSSSVFPLERPASSVWSV